MSLNGAFLCHSTIPRPPQKCDSSNLAFVIEVKNDLQHNMVCRVMLNPLMIDGLSGICLFMKLFTMKLIKENIALLYMY